MTAVRRAAPEEAGWVSELVATAFQPLKAVNYLLPDPAGRQEIMAANFRILVEHAMLHGHVDVLDEGPAVAVWFHNDREVPDPPDYDVRQAAAVGDNVERFRVLDELFGKNHPHEPHHHLAFLAVHPESQGRGLGSRLMEHHHAELGGLPAYLEASSPSSRALYLRHGYEPRETFALPDGTLFWPMWRPGA
ncbi:GNAT family N-acetyltransferase [Nonomuraea sp. NPDC050310]|uniref:GNAT family N-acetyltransferase n=1 Tax=unclassified Nonomuraea TaxID=2593643 RepID=UPI0033E2D4FF